MMRQFWTLIEQLRSTIPTALDDNNLEQWLLRQLHAERSLKHGETDLFSNYIHNRLPLIRELAQDYRPC
jgi:hypothetical protein